ncbi:cache domain-containing protein [Bradyrhizobium lupini]|uniref:cache domain-containing protein n=1 Tax=Rhizobium lupini TaxID=136996 RepID=UPI00366E5262
MILTGTGARSLPRQCYLRALKLRRSLSFKYFVTLFVAVVLPLTLGAICDAWFGYRDQSRHVTELLQLQSRSAAERIDAFADEIGDQLGWAVQFPWTDGSDNRHKIDALRLLQQVPAILSIVLVDERGTERVSVSRIHLNRMGAGEDMSADKAVIGARADKVWYGPVWYEHDSEPYMRIAVAGHLAAAGVAIADVNLKLIWDVISAIRIGETGHAIVVDGTGRLIAHPDMSQVLRGKAGSGDFRRLKLALNNVPGSALITTDIGEQLVVAAATPVAKVGWTVIALQPAREAFASLRAALWRALALITIGTLFALALAYALAQRMSGPIRELECGAKRIGRGQFDHRIGLTSGDELQRLASRFNEMARELSLSKQKSERIARLKRFLAPQVAELVENSDELLQGHRRDVVAVFADLRGFTAFSASAEPEIIIGALQEYYEVVGAVIARHEATLIQFAGDGVMILLNAPMAVADPAHRAVRLAIDLQREVQSLATLWSKKGCVMGFGIGIGMGPATVGTIGYEGRLDYTAVGSGVNLASRLCDLAGDGQILVDKAVAEQVHSSVPIACLSEQNIKGYRGAMKLFAVVAGNPPGMQNVGNKDRPQPQTQCRAMNIASYSAAADSEHPSSLTPAAT